MFENTYTIAFCCLLATPLFACGGAAVPQSQLTDAKTSVSAAEAVGAKDEPAAELHLKMAENGISDAEELIKEKRHEEAGLVLDRAYADAELALALTETANHKRAADSALARLEALEEDMKSKGNER